MDDEASLPKSTITKYVREALPADVRVASDSLDLLVKCSTEFVQLLASEANEVSGRQNKKTVTPEHVIDALKELGFETFLEDIQTHLQQHKEDAQGAPKISKKTKAEKSGLTEADQIAMQDRLFAEAKARTNM